MKFKNQLLVMLSILMLTVSFGFGTSTIAKDHSAAFENTCTVYVSNSYGSPAKSVKVSTEVSGGISCIGGREFKTNSDGKVVLKWVSGCYLKKIYVDGTGYEVNYKSGNTYYLTM